MGKMVSIVIALIVALFLLFNGLEALMGLMNPGVEPDYELPNVKRAMLYAPDEKINSLEDAYKNAGLELPTGISFIDYDTDEYILYVERYSKKSDVETTIFFYDGEEEISSVCVYYSTTDHGAEGLESQHEGSIRDDNAVSFVNDDHSMTKTKRLEEAAYNVRNINYSGRIYVGWSEKDTPEIQQVDQYGDPVEGAAGGPVSQAFGTFILSVTDRFGSAAPFAFIIIILFLLYFTVFRWYKNLLLRKYEFKIIGWPARFTMACYFLVTGLPTFFGIGSDPMSGPDDIKKLLTLLAVGAVGIIWQTVNCFIKTGNLFITVFNIPLMYIVCFFMGYLFVGYVAIFLLLGMGGAILGSQGGRGGTCPRCGAKVSGAGMCPGCGASLV